MRTLHPTKTVQALQPRYVGRFSCTGPACEDNCCTGWQVHIDKKTFTAYKQVQQPLLADRLANQVKRVRTSATDSRYARIELDQQTRACPFMEEKLCGIQRELGEDKLSDTCASYPRSNRVIHATHEQALTLSCPEAARLALLQSDAMDFLKMPISVRPANVENLPKKHGLSPQTMGDIRNFTLQLMQTDGLALWQKLAALGVFCEQLTKTLKRSDHAAIPSLITEVSAMVSSGAIAQALSAMQPDYAAQATVFSSLWQLRIKNRLSPAQEALQQAVALGLGASPDKPEVTPEQLVENYSKGVLRLPEAMKTVPWLLDHYVMNDMFNEVFPFSDSSPDEHYLKLVTRFGLVRLMLAAQCAGAAALPEPEQLARTVQIFCRLYQHDPAFAETVNTALKNSGWDSLEKIYRFLRT